MRKQNNKKIEFSKTLLIQESILVWITTLTLLLITCYCIFNGFMGTLPWLITLITVVWGAYGVSQVFYYKKSLAENTKNGVKYEAVLADINKELEKNIEKNETVLTDTDINSIYQTDGEDFSGYDMPDFSNPDEYQI